MHLTRTIALALPWLLASLPASATPLASVDAKYETQGYFDADFDAESDADDPAIWVHPGDSKRSLVIGTLKNGGLAVFDLKGKELQRIFAPDAPTGDDEPGRFNNVDLLLGFSIDGRATDLAVVSDRGRDKLVVYKIHANHGGSRPPLSDITAPDVPWVFSASQAEVNEQRTAYGLATQRFGGSTGAVGFVTQRERAKLAKVRFIASGGRVTYSVIVTATFPSSFSLPGGQQWTPCMDEDGVEPQFEGLVIDKDAKTLYAAQEPIGIWRMNFDFNARWLVEKVRSYGRGYERVFDPEEEEYACEYTTDPGHGGEHLSADAEGLTIYYVPNEPDERYLFASSQGDDSFSAWDIDEGQWEYEGSFELALGDDKNQECDGSYVVSAALNSAYPLGLFVSQDGNDTPDEHDEQGEVIPRTNFKFTPFDRIADALDLDL